MTYDMGSEMPEVGRGPTNRGIIWPPQCCVPAFLGSAVATLYERIAALETEEVRRRVAEISQVVLAPTDRNPWSLPTSANVSEFGVTRRKARNSFASIQTLLAGRTDLSLDIVSLNTIADGMYEDAIADFSRESGASWRGG